MKNTRTLTYPITLSKKTAGSINWRAISQVLDEQGLGANRGTEEPTVQSSDSVDYAERVAKACEAPKREFAARAAVLKRQVQLALWILFPALAIAIVAGVMLAVKAPIGGGLLSTGGLAALFGFMTRTWRLGRDQLILELFPARYEMLLGLCHTAQQYDLALNALMAEMVEMRRNAD